MTSTTKVFGCHDAYRENQAQDTEHVLQSRAATPSYHDIVRTTSTLHLAQARQRAGCIDHGARKRVFKLEDISECARIQIWQIDEKILRLTQ